MFFFRFGSSFRLFGFFFRDRLGYLFRGILGLFFSFRLYYSRGFFSGSLFGFGFLGYRFFFSLRFGTRFRFFGGSLFGFGFLGYFFFYGFSRCLGLFFDGFPYRFLSNFFSFRLYQPRVLQR